MSQAEKLVHVVLTFISIVNGDQWLQWLENSIPAFRVPSIQQVMFPNERTSLDDCNLRYYRYGYGSVSALSAGSPTYLEEFGHMAAIGWTQPNNTIYWNCGGSLIWENYVLTAAHCTLDNKVPPDVVRLGDIDILSDKDDQFAQQLKIVQIFRHPDYKFSLSYNDIALLKLEKTVTLNGAVSPACLWIDNEVRFDALEATGWGDTGFAQRRSSSLQKVTLKPTANEECSKFYSHHRLLKYGLKETQLCAGDDVMDTCHGDSGGPLQIKLLHNGKQSSFIVGITTFGVACGTATPGVYTKVSAYYQWILRTMRSQESNVFSWSLEPDACSLRNVHFRQYEYDAFAWQDGHTGDCSATLIDDDTALTLAECASHYGVAPSYVIVDAYGKNFGIAEIIVHPEYKENSVYNNIAVLKLKDRIEFSEQVTPACIWHSRKVDDKELKVAGIGRTDLNTFYSLGFDDQIMSEEIARTLLPRLEVKTPKNCKISEEFRSRLTRGLASEHLCTGNHLFLVPGSCTLLYGGPVQQQKQIHDRMFIYAFGLNAFGRDCGFGESAIATRLASHVDWLGTVLLRNFRYGQSAVQFTNLEWKENDSCNFGHNYQLPGICTHYTKCSKIWNDFKAKQRINFCSSAQVICCPRKFVENEFSQGRKDKLDACQTDYQQFHPDRRSFKEIKGFAHTITVTWNKLQRVRCLASLITKRTAVTSAGCALLLPKKPSLAILANNQSIAIEQVIVHPHYNNNDKSNDIALIKLMNEITPSASVFPACVWTNLTHTPFYLRLIEAGEILLKS
ncbi:uncharacterized protein LOC128740608 [Sabethes cyaneus]|uniref:uncharacterized protein LOC128740608 n=1 Tax=Sabethes cyaneus TaxID=53552 RepID=UPI00237EA16F|nr:uncharacterized protein LOC128740608 [Sabethes cyaneus]